MVHILWKDNIPKKDLGASLYGLVAIFGGSRNSGTINFFLILFSTCITLNCIYQASNSSLFVIPRHYFNDQYDIQYPTFSRKKRGHIYFVHCCEVHSCYKSTKQCGFQEY